MGYSVNSWETDFHIPADKMEAALADINADPTLNRPCWNRAHNAIAVTTDHDCQRLKTFDSLTDAVEELTGFHDCEEDDADGFRLGYHLERWMDCTEDLLHALGRYADEGAFVRLLGEDDELFGYRVVGGKLHTEDATVTWAVSPSSLARAE